MIQEGLVVTPFFSCTPRRMCFLDLEPGSPRLPYIILRMLQDRFDPWNTRRAVGVVYGAVYGAVCDIVQEIKLDIWKRFGQLVICQSTLWNYGQQLSRKIGCSVSVGPWCISKSRVLRSISVAPVSVATFFHSKVREIKTANTLTTNNVDFLHDDRVALNPDEGKLLELSHTLVVLVHEGVAQGLNRRDSDSTTEEHDCIVLVRICQVNTDRSIGTLHQKVNLSLLLCQGVECVSPAPSLTNVQSRHLLLRTTRETEGVPFEVAELRHSNIDVLARVEVEPVILWEGQLHNRVADDLESGLSWIAKERHVDLAND